MLERPESVAIRQVINITSSLFFVQIAIPIAMPLFFIFKLTFASISSDFSLLIPTTVLSAYCIMQMVDAYTVFSRP